MKSLEVPKGSASLDSCFKPGLLQKDGAWQHRANVPFQLQIGCDPLLGLNPPPGKGTRGSSVRWTWVTSPPCCPKPPFPQQKKSWISRSPLSSWKEQNTQRTRAKGYRGSSLGSFQLCVYQLHPLMVSARTGHPHKGLAGCSGLSFSSPAPCACIYTSEDLRDRPSGARVHLFTTQLMSWLNIIFLCLWGVGCFLILPR